jgi:hypothetical protein
MSGAITITAPGAATVGVAFSVAGTVSPAGDIVQVQLDRQNSTLPTGPWDAATTAAGTFAGVVEIVAPGTWYVWGYDPISGASAVSSAISVPPSALNYVEGIPVSTSIAASLLGGSAAGETPDELTTAAAAADTDTALVAQGGKTVFAQPFSAIWTWIQGHLPGYLLPQVTIAAAGTVQLDNSAHNQRLLLVTASGVTLTPLISSMGPGFACDVINASGSGVALAGMTTNTGAGSIAAGGIARILAATAPGGSLTVYAKL